MKAYGHIEGAAAELSYVQFDTADELIEALDQLDAEGAEYDFWIVDGDGATVHCVGDNGDGQTREGGSE